MNEKWIKRSDRNPKKRGAYLTYKEGIDEIRICNFGTSAGWENSRHLGIDNIYRVTHWMELPDKPLAQSNEKL